MQVCEDNQQVCHVPGCLAFSPVVVVYSTSRKNDPETHEQWMEALSLDDSYPVINACQRHFPAGTPTRNHPNPNLNLFNPIPKNTLDDSQLEEISIFNQAINGRSINVNEETLSAPVCPPPGSIIRLTANTTLIDLKKIKKENACRKPIRIEEVTVLIDEKNVVKVIDYGAKVSKNSSKQKRTASLSKWDPEMLEFIPSSCDEPSPLLFSSDSLSNALEQMRQHYIDCNVILTNSEKCFSVFAHSSVLISRSPYFFKLLYGKRKLLKNEFSYHKVVLPIDDDFQAVESVVSYMYTDSLDILLEEKVAVIRNILSLFEMKRALELFDEESSKMEHNEISENITHTKLMKLEPSEVELTDIDERKSIIFPLFDEKEEESTKSRKPPRKKKRRSENYDIDKSLKEENYSKMKVSVQKIVNALNPFFGKIEELFEPTSVVMQTILTSNYITTLWAENNLLTKLFNQDELTNYLTEIIDKILNSNDLAFQSDTFDNNEAYAIETLFTYSNNTVLDDIYTKTLSESHLDDALNFPVSNYQPLDPSLIPKYVHLIAVYRLNISIKGNKSSFIPHLLDGYVLQEDSNSGVLEDFVSRITSEDELLQSVTNIRVSFKQLSSELKKRVVSDLEQFVNPAFHEELIMRIVVNQMSKKNVLTLTLGLFLAKGCKFCRKKECKSEDLTLPISPDNPVCPDRECIKRNLQCHICEKQMATSKSLARHKYSIHDIQIGDTSGLFICSHCGETFSKKWKLNMHEKQHEDRKMEVKCHLCNKIIHGMMALKKHQSIVHEAKPLYSCEYCHKAFKRKETLIVHLRIHTGEKPFQCRNCDYASETKGNLKAHMLRKHKIEIIGFTPQVDQHDADSQNQSTESHVMATTLVAHNLPDGTLFLASANTDSTLVP